MTHVRIYIDDKIFRVPEIQNGAGLLAYVGKDSTYRLYQEPANPHSFDMPIEPLDRVVCRKGMSFYTIPESGPHGACRENDAELKERAKPFKPLIRKIVFSKPLT